MPSCSNQRLWLHLTFEVVQCSLLRVASIEEANSQRATQLVPKVPPPHFAFAQPDLHLTPG